MQPLMGWPPGCLLVHLTFGVTRLWECPRCFTRHACSSPLERDPHRSCLSSGSILCVTPERVIHSTRMGPRDLGFSLNDNWCVVWDPPLVVQFYCLGSRCPISSHCLVARRYILMIDVWPLFGTLAHVLCEIPAHAARRTRLRGTNITSGQRRPITSRPDY